MNIKYCLNSNQIVTCAQYSPANHCASVYSPQAPSRSWQSKFQHWYISPGKWSFYTFFCENGEQSVKDFHPFYSENVNVLKVFAVTLIEMIRNPENASSESVDNKECHFDRRIRFVSPTHVFVSGLSSKLSGEHSQDGLSNPATLGECGECEVIRNHFSQSWNIMLLVTQYLAIIRGWNRRVFSKLIDIIDWRRALSIYKERKNLITTEHGQGRER